MKNNQDYIDTIRKKFYARLIEETKKLEAMYYSRGNMICTPRILVGRIVDDFSFDDLGIDEPSTGRFVDLIVDDLSVYDLSKVVVIIHVDYELLLDNSDEIEKGVISDELITTKDFSVDKMKEIIGLDKKGFWGILQDAKDAFPNKLI